MSLGALSMHPVLIPFSADHAAEIACWARSPIEATAWAGNDTSFPVGTEQFRLWHIDPDVHPLSARQDGKLVAYGEVWVDHAEHEIELARMIVHPAKRGSRIGRAAGGRAIRNSNGTLHSTRHPGRRQGS